MHIQDAATALVENASDLIEQILIHQAGRVGLVLTAQPGLGETRSPMNWIHTLSETDRQDLLGA